MHFKQAKQKNTFLPSSPQQEGKQKRVTPANTSATPQPIHLMSHRAHPLAAKPRQDYFMKLQQTCGNQFVQRMIKNHMTVQRQPNDEEEEKESIQTKLKISQPGDKYEQEADRVAEQVTRISKPKEQRQPEEEEEEEEEVGEEFIHPKPQQITSLIQRQIEGEEEEEKEEDREKNSLQAKKIINGTSRIKPGIETQIHASRKNGQPLPKSARLFFEPRFGSNFKSVRVHTDTKADTLNRALNARAFTVGQDIFFRQGEYNPAIPGKRKLLAHELTHVVQQNRQQTLQRKVIIQTPPAPFDPMNLKERRAFIKKTNWGGSRNRNLARSILEDMASATDSFLFSDEAELKTEIIKRMSTSQFMKESQRRVKGKWGWQKGFGYPFTGSSLYYGPRVNYDAREYWVPTVVDNYAARKDKVKRGKIRRLPRSKRCKVYGDPCPGYHWSLSSKGKTEPYSAVNKLFTRQYPHKRTLIHCDYLVSLVHFRSFARAVGKKEFNQRIKLFGADKIKLKWNAFTDLESGTIMKRVLKGKLGPFAAASASLRKVRPSSPKDLVIGDHVYFWNHRSYDLINKKIGNAWRLENAVLIGKEKNKDIFLGHGSGRKRAAQLRARLAQEYNEVAGMALRLVGQTKSKNVKARTDARNKLKDKFPNVKLVGSEWRLKGSDVCGHSFDEKLRTIKSKEVIGLKDPCDATKMNWVRRPLESA